MYKKLRTAGIARELPDSGKIRGAGGPQGSFWKFKRPHWKTHESLLTEREKNAKSKPPPAPGKKRKKKEALCSVYPTKRVEKDA